MRHEAAFKRLPDLLDDRDDAELLAHVRECAECQRQLFLLGRVDRILRDSAAARAVTRRRRPTAWQLLTPVTVAAAAMVAALAFFVPQSVHPHALTLRTAAGRTVAQAVLGRSDARNASLALTARGMPLDRSRQFVLWAGDYRSSVQVGRFMVDRRGSCRARFNLPSSRTWTRFWITAPGSPTAVVATT